MAGQDQQRQERTDSCETSSLEESISQITSLINSSERADKINAPVFNSAVQEIPAIPLRVIDMNLPG